MTRDQVISSLKRHEAQMREAGIDALYLFGSVARGEAGPRSDVDLAADFDQNRHIGVLDMIEMQLKLEDLIGKPVGLVERSAMRARIAKSADHDSIRVF